MLKNVFLFTGEERYLLNKEIVRRKNNFAEKFGADTIFSFSSENFDISKVAEAIYGGGLFTTRKLIIISGLPTDTTPDNKLSVEKADAFIQDFLKKEGKIPDESLLIFISIKPDKRAKLFKFLEANAEVKVFGKMRSPQLKKYITEEMAPYTITPEAVELFLIKVGNDMFRVISEIDKLKWWCGENNIQKVDVAMIDNVTFGFTETNGFAFFDYLFTNSKKAITIMQELSEGGSNRNEVAGMIYRGLKLDLMISDIYSQGIHDAKSIAETLKVNPFSLGTPLKHINEIMKRNNALKKFFADLIRLDIDIKSGKYPDTYFWLAVKKMILVFNS